MSPEVLGIGAWGVFGTWFRPYIYIPIERELGKLKLHEEVEIFHLPGS